MSTLPSGMVVGLCVGRIRHAIEEAQVGRPELLLTIRKPEDLLNLIELVRWRRREPGEAPDPPISIPGSLTPPPDLVGQPTGIMLNRIAVELENFCPDDRAALIADLSTDSVLGLRAALWRDVQAAQRLARANEGGSAGPPAQGS